ncbi:RDD family protein [Gordoniibacillus kamchatkensis]|uniref:RDD family protein n=1 Tax=Gordoniibacillus kamchatkensis TaxID=1590651 RepID=UPI0006981290|nr:RDD family protein [Paenibacillus sp. VKM B-2647]
MNNVANEKIVYVDPRVPLREKPRYNVRPWHRYWARMIDVFVFSLILDLALFFAIDLLSLSRAESIGLGICFLLVWVPVEAILLSTAGSTLGKWLFNIRVRDLNGDKLSLRAALKRGFKVFLRGMGGGIPLVSFFCMLSAHSRLVDQGATSWDQGDLKIEHIPLGLFKKLICIAAVIGYLYLRFIEKIHLF